MLAQNEERWRKEQTARDKKEGKKKNGLQERSGCYYSVRCTSTLYKRMPGVGPPDVAHNHISWFNWRVLQRRTHIGYVEPRNELFCSIPHPIRTHTPEIKPVLFLSRLSMWIQHRAIYLSGRGIPGIGITSGILFYCSIR